MSGMQKYSRQKQSSRSPSEGYPITEAASQLGVAMHSLYEWFKKYSVSASKRQAVQGQEAEIRKLKAELKRVTEERDILKSCNRV
jgi:transposase-like protein